jgi:hypothetical protein
LALLQSGDALVAVVIALVPITCRVPTVLVFIPPSVTLAPAALPCRMQFATLVIRLPAVPSVVLDGFVQVMLSMLHAALAPVDVFCMQA